MTASRQFADPWPAPEMPWGDPPWFMSGVSVTAWFETAPDAVAALVSPAFEPVPGAAGVPTRLRFYRIDFEPRDGDAAFRHQMAGQFLEAVIAFKGRIAQADGEYSAYMWTDSDRYLAWGRENFGWPLVRGDIELSGTLWQDGGTETGSTCRLSIPGLTATLEVTGDRADDVSPGPGPNWLTPRRILFPGDGGPERRDLLVIRPEVVRPGRFTHRDGHVRLDASPGTWPASLAPLGGVQIHALEGFRICVGHDVSTVRESALC
ncbi:MAG: acetoacetate decarboxylase family protein [Streptosporangiaceae bacterium]